MSSIDSLPRVNSQAVKLNLGTAPLNQMMLSHFTVYLLSLILFHIVLIENPLFRSAFHTRESVLIEDAEGKEDGMRLAILSRLARLCLVVFPSLFVWKSIHNFY